MNRSTWRVAVLHLYTGLTAGFFLVVLGTTGALLAFEEEIDRGLNPHLAFVQPHGEHLRLEQLTPKAVAAYPGYRASALILPERADLSLIVSLVEGDTRNYLAVFIDPYTGKVLGDSAHANQFMSVVHRIHTRLALGGFGSALTFLGALGLIVLAASGVRLWLQGQRVSIHANMGIYAALFVLPFAITGFRPIPLGMVWTDPWTKPGFRVPPQPGVRKLSPDELVDAATRALPGAQPVSLGLMGREADFPLDVYMRWPEDHSSDGRSIVYVNPYTGGIQAVTNSREMNAAARYAWVWNWQIHTGRIFSRPSQLAAGIASASLPVVALSGVLLWWKRKRRSTFVPRRKTIQDERD